MFGRHGILRYPNATNESDLCRLYFSQGSQASGLFDERQDQFYWFILLLQERHELG